MYKIPSDLSPNARLERKFISGKGAFGRPLAPAQKEAIRKEILFRNEEGIYVFTGRAEQRRLKMIRLTQEADDLLRKAGLAKASVEGNN
jgi:hypothetical protein